MSKVKRKEEKPETHTVLGFVCHKMFYPHAFECYWLGGCKSVTVKVFDRSPKSSSDLSKRYLVEIVLSRVNNITILAEGPTLVKAQYNVCSELRNRIDQLIDIFDNLISKEKYIR